MSSSFKWIGCLLAGCFLILSLGCGGSKSPDKFIEIGRQYYRSHDYLKAKEQFIAAMKLAPENRIVAGYIGKILYRQGQMFDALKPIEAGLVAMTNDVELLEYRAVLHYSRLVSTPTNSPNYITNRVLSLRSATQALHFHPTNDVALELVSNLLSTAGDEPALNELLQSLTARAGEYIGYELVRARQAAFRGNRSLARTLVAGVLKKEPNHVPGLLFSSALDFSLGRTNEAVQTAKTAARLSPPYGDARMQYVNMLRRTGDIATAKQELDEIIRLSPERTVAYNQRAEIALLEKKPEEAVKLLESAVNQTPMDSTMRMLQAKAYLDLNQYSNVLETYSFIAQRLPRGYSYDLHFNSAQAYLGLKQYTNAMQAFTRAARSNPTNYSAPNLLAELKLMFDRPNEAVDILLPITRKATNALRSEQLLGKAYMKARRLEEALEVFDGMKRRGIESADIYFDSGTIHAHLAGQAKLRIQEATQLGQARGLEVASEMRRREVANARRDLNRARTLAPKSVDVLEALIDLELSENQPAEAKKLLEPFITQIDKSERLLLLRSRVSFAEKKRESAEADLGTALDLNPSFYPAYLQLAELYLNSGDLEGSLNKIDQILQPNSTNTVLLTVAKLTRPRFLLLRGIICMELQRFEEAVTAYREVIQTQPQNVLALNNLAYVLGENLGRVDEAYAFAMRAWQASSENFLHADTLGWLEYKRGDYSTALRLISQAQQYIESRTFSQLKVDDMSRAEVDIHLGHVSYMMGIEDAAFENLQRSVRAITNSSLKVLTEQRLEFLTRLRDPALRDPKPLLETRLKADPKDVVAILRWAQLEEQGRNSDAARRHYSDALAANPKLSIALLRLAALTIDSDPATARSLTQRAQALDPNNPELLGLQGRLASYAGELDQARNSLTMAIQTYTNTPELQLTLAQVEVRLGRLKEAFEAARAASTLPAGKSLADTLDTALDPAKAEAALPAMETLLKQQPTNVLARYTRAVALVRQNKAAAARDEFEGLLKSNPNFLIAARDLCILYAGALADDAKAFDFGTRARGRIPDDPLLNKHFGIVLSRRGEHGYAIQILESVTGVVGKDAEVQFSLGKSYFALKRYDEARKSLETAIAIDPSSKFIPEARRLLKEAPSGG